VANDLDNADFVVDFWAGGTGLPAAGRLHPLCLAPFWGAAARPAGTHEGKSKPNWFKVKSRRASKCEALRYKERRTAEGLCH